MLNNSNVDLKICGITSSQSIITAANNNIRSLGFASSNLPGPNTCDDKSIKNFIEECNYYKIKSVLLSRYRSTLELIKQIDYTKPKIIACSYFFKKKDLIIIKKIFKKLKIGISVNPENFDLKYFQSIAEVINIFYYDLNVYNKDKIITFSICDYKNQINLLKSLNKPIYVGGGIDKKNVKLIIRNATPQGLDISRSLKDDKNNLCEKKLNELLKILAADLSL